LSNGKSALSSDSDGYSIAPFLAGATPVNKLKRIGHRPWPDEVARHYIGSVRSIRACLGVASALALLALVSPANAATSAVPVLLAPVPNSHYAFVIEASSSGCGHAFCLWFSRISDPPAPSSDRHLPSLHPLAGQPTGNLESLQFTSPDDGYLWAREARRDVLYVTTDGAKSWQRRVSTSSLLPVHSFSATLGHIYFVTGVCSAMGTCRGFQLHSAGANGAVWTRRPLGLAPVTDGVGLGAVGSDLWIEDWMPAGARMLFSTNQGRTFVTWPVGGFSAYTGCIMTAINSSHLWADCPTGMNHLYEVSVDGGHHWRAIHTGGLISSTAGGAFDPVSAKFAYVDVGADAKPHGDDLLRASPDGMTVGIGRLGCSNLIGLDFVSRTNGLAVCQETARADSATLIMTSDNGRTWIPFH
jgi:hypothetical protein